MGRKYAGILGPLAFATLVARGLLGQHGIEATLLAAACCAFAFAALGYVIGELAGWTVAQATRAHFKAELESLVPAESTPASKSKK